MQTHISETSISFPFLLCYLPPSNSTSATQRRRRHRVQFVAARRFNYRTGVPAPALMNRARAKVGSIHVEGWGGGGEYHKHKLGSDLNAAFSCAISGGFTTAGRMSGPDKANHRCKPRAVGFSPTPTASPHPPNTTNPLQLQHKAD